MRVFVAILIFIVLISSKTEADDKNLKFTSVLILIYYLALFTALVLLAVL